MLAPMDSQTERQYFGCDDSLPEFPCSAAECPEASHNERDFAKCEGCNRRFCGLCLVKFEDLLFCSICASCAECAAPATALCVECGELTCASHSTPKGDKARLCHKCDATKARVAV